MVEKNTLGDIPDDIRFKPYMPLSPNTWAIFKEFGWDLFYEFNLNSEKGCYDFFALRFNESISTSSEIVQDKLEKPDKILSYVLVLPNVVIRADLMQGTQRLFMGDSADVTYIILKHDTQEVFALLNAHLEGGLPADWWFVQPDDELLDRRHLKLGIKMRDIPKKMKDMRKSSEYLIGILKDIRNERTPQWASADYYGIIAYETFALNLLYEPSSYEGVLQGYDGWASKEKFGLPDYTFALVPWPQMLNMFMYQGRAEFTKKVSSMTAKGNLYIAPFEEENKKLIKEMHSHVYEWYEREKLDKGIPYPIQSLNVEFPNLKNKDDPENRFKYKYPKGEWIKPDDLGLSNEELQKGVYLNIDHNTKVSEKVTNSNIVSIGVGKDTKFF